MKKLFFIAVIALICSGFIFNACNGPSKGGTTEQRQAVKIVYTCEMHPEVISDKPGNCPKCGMQLVKKEVPATDTSIDSMKN